MTWAVGLCVGILEISPAGHTIKKKQKRNEANDSYQQTRVLFIRVAMSLDSPPSVVVLGASEIYLTRRIFTSVLFFLFIFFGYSRQNEYLLKKNKN